jgi:large subunit ribosomal protein L32
MAEPKKRVNKSRRGTRRRGIKEALPSYVHCSNCHEANLPHAVCKNCGYYNGKLVLEKKEKTDTTEAETTKEAGTKVKK